MMLCDQPRFTREQFLPLVGFSGSVLDWRNARGEIIFTGGSRINAYVNAYIPLDACYVMLTTTLARQMLRSLPLRAAARLVGEYHEAPLQLIQTTEDDPQLYIKLPLPKRQSWFVVGLEHNKPPRVAAGRHHDCMDSLGGCPLIGAVSIHQLLHMLRVNAAAANLPWPSRLTVSASDPRHAQWRDEISAYQRIAHQRFTLREQTKEVRHKPD